MILQVDLRQKSNEGQSKKNGFEFDYKKVKVRDLFIVCSVTVNYRRYYNNIFILINQILNISIIQC